MACGTGFCLDLPPEVVTGGVAGLIRIYRMDTERVGGKIRCSADTTRQTTEAKVPITVRDVVRYGFKTQETHFEMTDVPCPFCSARQMVYEVQDGDRCPCCNKGGLSKALIWGSFV